MSHTPGPWSTDTERGYLHDPDWGRFQVYDAEGYVVAVTIGDTTEMAQAEEANARLIAAAPGLLEALKYARRFLNADDHDLAFVDAAIAKVEGTTQDAKSE